MFHVDSVGAVFDCESRLHNIFCTDEAYVKKIGWECSTVLSEWVVYGRTVSPRCTSPSFRCSSHTPFLCKLQDSPASECCCDESGACNCQEGCEKGKHCSAPFYQESNWPISLSSSTFPFAASIGYIKRTYSYARLNLSGDAVLRINVSFLLFQIFMYVY